MHRRAVLSSRARSEIHRLGAICIVTAFLVANASPARAEGGADLQASKQASASVVAPGATVVYTIAALNWGPDDATGVTLTDTLPAGVVATAMDPDCAAGTDPQEIVCDAGVVASGGSAGPFDITVTMPTETGEVTNSVVAGASNEAGPQENTASAAVTVATPSADLAVSKFVTPNPVGVGLPLTYTVSVRNDGPFAATDVTVTDTLPSGVTVLETTPACDVDPDDDRVLHCAMGDLAVHATATLEIDATAPVAPGDFVNSARAAAASPDDPDPADNVAQTRATAVSGGDLSIDKRDSKDPVATGERFDYEIEIFNGGPGAVADVVVTDALPAGTAFVSASDPSCGHSGGVVTCSFDSIGAGESATITLTVDAPSSPGSIRNAATVSAEDDTNAQNNEATEDTTVLPPGADLEISKEASDPFVEPGGTGEFTIQVTNNGPDVATNVEVEDSLPAGVGFVSASTSAIGGDCSFSDPLVTCALGSLEPLQSASVTLTVELPLALGVVVNTATVSSATEDADQQNNSDSAEVTVTDEADLAITKSSFPNPADPGSTPVISLQVFNFGPVAATGVVLTDVLPEEFTFLSDDADDPTDPEDPDECAHDAGVVTCSIPRIEPHSSFSVALTVQVPLDDAVYRNTATVSSGSTDPDPSNNADTDTLIVGDPALADLSLTGYWQSTPVSVGQNATLQLNLYNAGPETATGVQIRTEVHPSLTFVSASPGCAEAGSEVVCDVGDVDPISFTGLEIVFAAVVDAEIHPPSLVSLAAPADPNLDNNEVAPTLVVLPEGAADLQIFASAGGSPSVGAPLPYYLYVANQGPSTASGVQVLYELPDGATFDYGRVDGGSCSEASGLVTCDLPDLEPYHGSAPLISIVPGSEGDLVSTFTVEGDGHDPNPEDNTATVESTSLPEGAADLGISLAAFGSAAEGTPFEFYAFVNNNGPAASTGTVARITLPSGWSLGDAGWFGGECTEDGRSFVCPLGDFGAYNYQYIRATATPMGAGAAAVDGGGGDTITATVEGDGPDAEPDNNSAELAVSKLAAGASDLHMFKSGPAQAAVGEPFVYSLWVSASGPAAAEEVVVTDVLDARLELVGTPVTTRGTCDAEGQEVTCALGTLGQWDYAQIHIKVRATEEGTIDNTASVSHAADDPNPDGNEATHAVEVLGAGAADLAIFKSGDWGGAAGAPYSFYVHVANAGPSTANGVRITDPLPDGVTFQAATASQGTCSHAGGVVQCEIGTVPPYHTQYATITVVPSAPGTLTNTATVSFDGDDPNESNDSAEFEATVFGPGSADLDLQKSAVGYAAVGQDARFLIRVTNNGPSPAGKVVVTDPLPEGTTFVKASSSQGKCVFTTEVVCKLGTVGLYRSATIEVVVEPQEDGTIENVATVAHESDDPDSKNDSDGAEHEVAPEGATDVMITKSAFGMGVVGEPVDYAIGVFNNGWSGAQDVVVKDLLPAGLTFVSATLSSGDPCPEALGIVTCEIGDMQPFGYESISLRVIPTEVGEVENTATVTTESTDVDPDNNEATKTIDVVPAGTTDVSISKSGWWTSAAAQDPYSFWLSVYNHGPAAAPAVVVTDTVPGTMTIQHVSPSTGSCTTLLQKVTCELGTLPAYHSGFVEIAVIPQKAGDFTNTATVTTAANDSDGDNDEAEFELTVFEPGTADLAIDKVDSADPAAKGKPFHYFLTITGAGPDVAEDAVVTDTLPPSVTFLSASASQGTCVHDASAHEVSCALGDVHPFGYVTVVITVVPSTTGTLLNTAKITHGGPDPDTEDNTASEQTTVVPNISGEPKAEGGQVDRDETTGEVTVTMRRSELQPIEMAIPAFCPDGSEPDSVTLSVGTFTVEMTLESDGLYHASIPLDAIQAGNIVITVVCDDEPVSNDVGTIQLYDPSGDITDAKTGDPVVGATVLLYNVPGWRARTGPADLAESTCESNESKDEADDWSQPAPVDSGVLASPLSGTIDPGVNPLITDAVGHYGWDVAAGCWFVTVAKAGYALRVSPVVGVPPEVTDLDLTLEPLSVSLGAPASVVYGKPVALSGKVTAPAGCRSRTLLVQRDLAGGAVNFETVTTTTSNASTGAWAKSITASGKAGANAVWRVLSEETSACGLMKSATKTVKVAKALSLKSSASSVPAGSPVTLTATLAPCGSHAGSSVTLQRKSGTKFVTVKSAKVNSKCVAAFRVTITATTIFRVIAAADSDHAAGTSAAVTVKRR